MTEAEAKKQWRDWMYAQVGYHEYGSNGTKYADDSNMDEKAYGFSMAGSPWCDFFFDYSMWKNFGYENGQKMLYQTGKYGGAAVSNSASFYRQAGAFYHTPEVGDQAIYAGENHTGGVVDVNSDGTFNCIDGNYSDAVTLRKNLSLTQVSGFGRPDWSVVAEVETEETTEAVTEETEEATTSSAETATEIKAGDLVKVKQGAVWYTGTRIADMVYQHSWYVLSVRGGRAVINESEDGSRHIMSPISTEYLELVKTGSENVSEEEYVNSQAAVEASPELYYSVTDETNDSGYPKITITADQVPTSENPTSKFTGIGGVIAEKIASWRKK